MSFYQDDGNDRHDRVRFGEEDVLIYEHENKLLRMKTSAKADRDRELRLFAKHLAGDESLAERALNEEIFSLAPVQEGRFAYGGRNEVFGVTLSQVTVRVYGQSNSVLTLQAKDVRRAFATDLGALSLNSGLLLRAKLCFEVHRPGRRTTKVTVEIVPPGGIRNLKERWYSQPVLQYLEEEGVKLR